MPKRQQPRRARVRTQPTTDGPLPLPGSADPRRHLECIEYAMQLQNPVEGELVGDPIEQMEYADRDLGRRLTRRGWRSLGTYDSSWVYPASLECADDPESPDVVAAEAEQEAEFTAHWAAMSEWLTEAEASGANSRAEAEELIGPEPFQPAWRIQEAEDTYICTGEDGASYDIVGPGFTDTCEKRVYTDRHDLLRDLDDIEAWRYNGPRRRTAPQSEPTTDAVNSS